MVNKCFIDALSAWHKPLIKKGLITDLYSISQLLINSLATIHKFYIKGALDESGVLYSEVIFFYNLLMLMQMNHVQWPAARQKMKRSHGKINKNNNNNSNNE